MTLTKVLYSQNHIQKPFSHEMRDGTTLYTTEKKTQIIALSILVGVFTLVIGGVLLFYSLAAKYKVEKIKQFTSKAARETNLSSISPKSLSKICAYLPDRDLHSLARVNKEIGATPNNKLIMTDPKNKSTMKQANDLGWNLNRDKPNLDIQNARQYIQSAEQYLSELFTAVKRLGENRTIPYEICVYYENTRRGDFSKKINAKATIENLKFLAKGQLTTLLIAASEHGAIGIIKFLLYKGANINAAKNEPWKIFGAEHQGWTSLHIAADKGHYEIVK